MAFSSSFLESFAEFIISKFGMENLRKELKIILPNNLSCLELQKILTTKYGMQNLPINLPIIIPFSVITSKKDFSTDCMSKMEELFILSKIITEYKELKFTTDEALKAAEILNKLFADLINNNSDIKLIETYNSSKYWQKIYRFLEYCFLGWQEKLATTKKRSRNSYKLKLLLEEVIRTKNSGKQVILAGIFKSDSFLRKYEEELQKQNIPLIKYNEIKQYNTNISYYEPASIYEEAEAVAYICRQNTDKKIAIVANNDKFKKIYCNALGKYTADTSKARSQISGEPAQRTVVREHRRIPKFDVPNLEVSKVYSLAFEDLIGNDLKLTNVSQLLICIITILCNNFNLKLLFLLLKNPLINCGAVQELELKLTGKNRFISSPKYLLQIVKDSENTGYYQELITILYKHDSSGNILVLAKEIAEKLLPNIWEKEGGAELLEFLINLTEFSNYINLIDKKDFPKTFAFLLSNIKYYKNTESANIIIGLPEDLALSKFDLVILPHFNSENWNPAYTRHPYLSKKAKQILNIDYDEINAKIYSDYFDLFQQNKEIIILNAKKYDGKFVAPCNLFLKLQNVIPAPYVLPVSYVIPAKAGIQETTNIKLDSRFCGNDIRHAALSTFFPTVLSVTDIEILIRSPYSFYAKKILGLRKKDKIWEEPKISDFGNFIHKVLEEYSKNYDKQYITLNLLDKQNALINIGNNILHSSILPIYTKKTWQTKLVLLSKAFILFDIERRKNCQEIYFEIKGELSLNIAGQDIKIIGIADRIEISKSNRITILDYKTGTIPTKKEIELGLSPQLIIESLMLLENGFSTASFRKLDTSEFSDIRLCSRTFVRSAGSVVNSSCLKLSESSCINKEITIAYVKITSTEPYVQTTEISLSREVLDKHKKGLIKLLEYYVINKSFTYDLDLSQYNDYLHLTR